MRYASSPHDKRCWFKPKRYGYGAYPVTWEGWSLILIFLISIFLSTLLIKTSPVTYVALSIFLLLALIIISRKKTDGEWKWRWGEKGTSVVKNKNKKSK